MISTPYFNHYYTPQTIAGKQLDEGLAPDRLVPHPPDVSSSQSHLVPTARPNCCLWQAGSHSRVTVGVVHLLSVQKLWCCCCCWSPLSDNRTNIGRMTGSFEPSPFAYRQTDPATVYHSNHQHRVTGIHSWVDASQYHICRVILKNYKMFND